MDRGEWSSLGWAKVRPETEFAHPFWRSLALFIACEIGAAVIVAVVSVQ